MKLISNTSFGDLCKSKENEFSRRIDYLDWFERVRTNFDNFLKQPLKLEMFVPCDEDGNVLEEIVFSEQVHIYLNYQEKQDYVKRCDVYKKAKEKVLFEDCELYEDVYVVDKNNFQIVLNSEHVVTITKDNIIEDLSFSDNYYLTPNAIKQLGL